MTSPWAPSARAVPDGAFFFPSKAGWPSAPLVLPPLERAESSDSDSESSSDSDDIDGVALPPSPTPAAYRSPAPPSPAQAARVTEAMTPASLTRATLQYADHRSACFERHPQSVPAGLASSGVLRLPQRPDTAVTRTPLRPSSSRRHATVRSEAFDAQQAQRTPPSQLCSPPRVPPKPQAGRSEDRARAAQRLFRTLGQPHAAAPEKAGGKPSEEPVSPGRNRISLLYGLYIRARRRHMEREQSHHSHAKGHSDSQEAAVQSIELVVTPPTPQMPETSSWNTGPPVTGVRITSHRLALTAPEMPTSPTLQPPPFELAPGRARILAERRRRMHEQAQHTAAEHPPPQRPAPAQCPPPRPSSAKYVAPGRRRQATFFIGAGLGQSPS